MKPLKNLRLKRTRFDFALIALVLLLAPWLYQKWIFWDGAALSVFTPIMQQHVQEMDKQNQSRLKTAVDNGSYSHPDPRFTAQAIVQHREKIREQMLKSGVPEREVNATLTFYDSLGITRANERVGKHNPRIYVLPEWAERRVIRGQPVWLFGSHWESMVVNGGCPQVPIHVWFVAIRGVWPHDVLYSEQCG